MNFDIQSITPTYGDLLAKGYIKVAHALKPLFHTKLLNTFGEANILVAPIKELRRVSTVCVLLIKSKFIPQ
jgi:hypothetical protein